MISLFLIIVLFAVYYVVAFIDINVLMDYVEDVFKGKYSVEETEGYPVNIYNYTDREDFYSVDLKLNRVFVWHNFSDGYIWAKYVVRGYNSKGEHIYGGGSDEFLGGEISTRWKIHKENGEWKIVDINEAP